MDQSCTSPPEALPKWLTEEYFRSLFRRKSPGEEVAVQNVAVKFADEERIHGKLIRVAVDVVTPGGAKTLSYVVKRPAPGLFSTTPASANMNRMESLVLGEVIPSMEKVLDAVAPGQFGQLAPRLVDYGLGENRFIMTEDLSVEGFSTVSRQTGLDLEHSLAYVKHLAAFHAASVAVMDRYEAEIRAIPLLIDSEEVKFLNEFIANSMKGVESVIDSWEEGSKYADQVRKLGASLPSRLAQANRSREGLAVLCHGDMFVNNILFRAGGAGGGPAVRLVDFQLSRVGSFADDLAGFLVSATSDEVLRHHWERVSEEYREALNAALHSLGHGARALSQEAVRDALRAQRPVAQFALFHVLPHSRAPAAVDLRTAGGPAFQQPSYLALLRLLLPRFRALGWLDEFHSTTGDLETGIPSWLNFNKYQRRLSRSTLACLQFQFQRAGVISHKEESASTTDVFQAAVEASFPSSAKTQFSRVICRGNAEINKMPTQSCMLKMETRVLGKLIPAAGKIVKGAVRGRRNSQARSFPELGKNSRYFMRKGNDAKPTLNHKSSELKFCLAAIRHLVLLHTASMIALDQKNRISDVAIDSSSVYAILSHLAFQQAEKTGKGNAPGDRVPLDTHETSVGDEENQLDSQKSTVEQSDENEQICHTKVTNESFQTDSLNSTVKQRLHESAQERRKQEVSKICNAGRKVKKISCVNHINNLGTPAESVIRDNKTELAHCFKSFSQNSKSLSQNSKSRPGVLPSNYPPRCEDLESRLRIYFPVGQISFPGSPRLASNSEGVGSARNPSSVHLFGFPHLGHCGLSERFLSRFNITGSGHMLFT